MTPQERQLVKELFDRLASLEAAPRDPDAERLIADGLARAPHAVYPLVQTVLLQEEALKRANERINELEAGDEAPQGRGGFLDNMRDAFLGRDDARRGSVPSVGGSKWGSGQAAASAFGTQPAAQQGMQPDPRGGGSSFLGTAAAAAAGVIGGSLLLNGIQSLMGGHQGQAHAFGSQERQNPWSNDDASRSDLARDAGVNDIGGDGGRGGDGQRAGLFGDSQGEGDDSFDVADMGDFGGDGGGDA
jgi:hypothetical protein